MAKWAPRLYLIGGFWLYVAIGFLSADYLSLLIWMGINLALTLILMVVVRHYRVQSSGAIISNEYADRWHSHFWKGNVTLKTCTNG